MKFSTLKKSDMLIFHKKSQRSEIHDYIKHLFDNFDFLELVVNKSQIYLNPLLIILFFKNFFLMRGIQEKSTHKFRLSYYASLLDIIKPKVVVAIQDADIIIEKLSLYYPKSEFVIFQHGMRLPHFFGLVYKEKIKMKNLLTWGDYTKELYDSNGAIIENYINIGSIPLSLYKKRRERLDKKFDLCLISQWRPFFEKSNKTEFEYKFFQGMLLLCTYINKFLQDNEIRFCIATTKGSLDSQKKFFNEHFHKPELIAYDNMNFKSYQVVDMSDVSIGLTSSLLFESFSLGNKTFFGNFSEIRNANVIENYKWMVHDKNMPYKEFETLLNDLLEISSAEYQKEVGNTAHKFIADIDSEEKLKNIISPILVKEVDFKELGVKSGS